MQGTPLTRKVETRTTANEVQSRNGQDHQRVFDPEVHRLLENISAQLERMNTQLEIITGEKV